MEDTILTKKDLFCCKFSACRFSIACEHQSHSKVLQINVVIIIIITIIIIIAGKDQVSVQKSTIFPVKDVTQVSNENEHYERNRVLYSLITLTTSSFSSASFSSSCFLITCNIKYLIFQSFDIFIATLLRVYWCVGCG